MKKLILSVAIIATFLTACSKKKDDPTPATTTTTTTTNTTTTPTNTTTTPTNTTTTPTNTTTTPSAKTVLLTTNYWNYTGATADKPVDEDGDGTSSTDVYSQLVLCQTDVQMQFSTDKTAFATGDCGGKPSSLTKYNFKWDFNTDETAIIIGSVTETIVQLDATTLKLSYSTKDHNGLSYIQTDTYTKQ